MSLFMIINGAQGPDLLEREGEQSLMVIEADN